MQHAIDPTAASALLYVALFLVVLTRPRRRRTNRRAKTIVFRSRPWHEPPPLDLPSSTSDRRLAFERKRLLVGSACAAWGVLSAVMLVAALLQTSHITALADASNRTVWKASSASQYTLTGSDGSTWHQLDNTNLTLTITPTANSTPVLSANSSLFTNAAGYNQDLAICVNPSTTASCTASGAQVVVWKEAGGYSAYKPATVYDQAAYAMNAGTTYTVSLYWKTNTSDSNTIYAGAGSSPTFSPTSVSAVLTPTSESLVASATSAGSQYTTSSTTWQLMDSSNLDTTFTAPSNGTALLTANADLFTLTSGTDQDLGICVAAASSLTSGCGNGTVVSWADNGGYSAYMPIAALVEGTAAVTSGTQYTVGIVWRAESAHAIDAGAGPSSPFSLSSVIAQLVPTSDNELSAASTTSQLARSYSGSDNGTSWADMATSSLSISYTPSTNVIAYLGGNASLFANSGNYNIDLGICVAAGSGSCSNVGWTDSGSATAYSPDATYLQVPYSLTAGTAYTIRLQWRTNVPMATGNAIYSGAGSSSPYSPTTLSALFVPYGVPGAPTNVVARAVADTDSTGAATVTWTAPSSPGSSITQYTITPYVATTAQTSLAQTDTDVNGQGVVATSYGVPGLTKGTAYTFQVTATNAAGQGPPGTSNLVTASAPPAYTIGGSSGTTSSPIITAPPKGYDDGKAAQDGTRPQQVVLGQVANASAGWPDLVTANGSGANAGDSISVLQNLKSTNASFAQPAATTAPGEAATQVALGNIFGHSDGVADAVIVNGGSTIYVLSALARKFAHVFSCRR